MATVRTPALGALLALGLARPLTAQEPGELLAFDRPESWALKYFAAVSTFTAVGPPVTRRAGSLELGVEVGWIPWLTVSERRVGFNGTAVQDLNKTRVLGRPKLIVGLPGGISAEVGWVPPVVINGGKASLIAGALERPVYGRGPWVLGLRAFGQIGHASGDYTCPEGVVAYPSGSPENPLGCEAPSRDGVRLNLMGAAVTGGSRIGGGVVLHAAAGATHNDLRFQVGARTNGFDDHTILRAHGWTGFVAGGFGYQGSRVAIGFEAFYSPLMVRRPPGTGSGNEALLNARAVLRYRLR